MSSTVNTYAKPMGSEIGPGTGMAHTALSSWNVISEDDFKQRVYSVCW